MIGSDLAVFEVIERFFFLKRYFFSKDARHVKFANNTGDSKYYDDDFHFCLIFLEGGGDGGNFFRFDVI